MIAPAGVEHDKLRQCALLLHGACANDRDWLLAQLPQVRARELRGLVRELQALGIPADGELALSLIAGEGGADGGSDDADGVWDAAEVAALLADEPPQLVAQACACLPVGREALLSALGPSLRGPVREVLRGGMPSFDDGEGSRLKEVLQAELVRRLAARAQERAARRTPRPADSVLERLRERWRRVAA